MNRRELLRRLAIGASGLVVAESVRDFMAWEAKRIFALGGIPKPRGWLHVVTEGDLLRFELDTTGLVAGVHNAEVVVSSVAGVGALPVTVCVVDDEAHVSAVTPFGCLEMPFAQSQRGRMRRVPAVGVSVDRVTFSAYPLGRT